jgi:lipid-A-disaccharide synthase-like uncharacterized protein
VDEEATHSIHHRKGRVTVSTYLIYALGFFAQALFGSRMIIQWISSERAGKVESPTLFWQTSLVASFLFIIYGLLRYDSVIILGQLLSYYIYIRNLQLKDAWKKIPFVLRLLFLFTPALTILLAILLNPHIQEQLQLKNDFTDPMMIMGAISQLILNLRFLYQWYYSEKRKQSVLSTGFWVLSLVGSVLVVIYAAYRLDPVLLLSQSLGLIVYIRNLYIGFKQKP